MWWIYSLLLFFISFFLGIVSVLAGIGGASIFVPVAATLFPFSFDFIRGAGLFVALGSSISATPRLIKKGYADLRLALPFMLTGSFFSVFGAIIGLAIDEKVIKLMLGVVMICVSIFMISSRKNEYPLMPEKKDKLASMLGIGGIFTDNGRSYEWGMKNTLPALAFFAVIGIISGMFGIGGGWAGVPVMNLVAGVPIKLAAGTSSIIISANASAAIWIYFRENAVFPLIALPSFFGVALGSRIGTHLMGKVNSGHIRIIIILFLSASGLRLVVTGINKLFL